MILYYFGGIDMGMFDTVIVDKSLAKEINLECKKCNTLLDDFQTKSLHNAMEDYFLTKEGENIKLKYLDSPSEKAFWHEYTEDEIEEYNKDMLNSRFASLFTRKKGDGYFTKEAFLPKNRKQRDMGEMPHQWVEVYTSCPHCSTHNEYVGLEVHLKFTDGVLKEHKVEHKSFQTPNPVIKSK